MATADAFAIGALSRRTGVNIETIRYYERTGLLPRPVRSAGGFRLYIGEDAARLSFIRRARDLGFSLDDIRRLLDLADGRSQSCRRVQKIAEQHLVDIRAKLADLRRMERILAMQLRSCAEGRLVECPLLDALAAA